MDAFYDYLKDKENEFTFAIRKVDDIIVRVYYMPNDHSEDNDSDSIIVEKNDNILWVGSFDNKDQFKQAMFELSCLKLNNKEGNMSPCQCNNDKFEDCYTFKNVISVYDECSVCYELTRTNLSCNHILCYKCYDKIYNLHRCFVCPICRRTPTSNFTATTNTGTFHIRVITAEERLETRNAETQINLLETQITEFPDIG